MDEPRTASLAYLAEGAAEAVRIGIEELRMVKSIEHFGAELKRLGFRKLCLLEERKVPIVDARPAQRIAPQVSERGERTDGVI